MHHQNNHARGIRHGSTARKMVHEQKSPTSDGAGDTAKRVPEFQNHHMPGAASSLRSALPIQRQTATRIRQLPREAVIRKSRMGALKFSQITGRADGSVIPLRDYIPPFLDNRSAGLWVASGDKRVCASGEGRKAAPWQAGNPSTYARPKGRSTRRRDIADNCRSRVTGWHNGAGEQGESFSRPWRLCPW